MSLIAWHHRSYARRASPCLPAPTRLRDQPAVHLLVVRVDAE